MTDHQSLVRIIVSRIIKGIQNNLGDIERQQNFKINVPGIPGKYYLDRISGSYEDSLHNLIHKIMWYKKIYHEIISCNDELKKIEDVVNNYPDEIYKPDSSDANNESEIEFYESLHDEINIIHFKSIMGIKEYLSRFPHFDSAEFEYEGYTEET